LGSLKNILSSSQGWGEPFVSGLGSSLDHLSSSHEFPSYSSLKVMEEDESSRDTKYDLILYHLRNKSILDTYVLNPLPEGLGTNPMKLKGGSGKERKFHISIVQNWDLVDMVARKNC
jgi:hypothetical protein